MNGVPEIPAFIESCPEIDVPVPGARGWLLQAGDKQVVVIDFAETVEVPEHSHAEQWEFALRGKVELRREGRTEVIEAGDNFFVPAGQVHGATVHAGYRGLILFNEADRYPRKS